MSEDLIDWLYAQLDLDQQKAAAFSVGTWVRRGQREVYSLDGDAVAAGADRAEAEFIADHDPARVLRDVRAYRLIIDDHAGPADGPYVAEYCEADGGCRNPNDRDLRERMPCRYLRLLAAIFSDRPGFREEWRP